MVDVPLSATHHLRNVVNNGKAPSKETLALYEIPIVASLLKLYLLELPGNYYNPEYSDNSNANRFPRVFAQVRNF